MDTPSSDSASTESVRSVERPGQPATKRPSWFRFRRPSLLAALLGSLALIAVATLAVWEMRGSRVQSWLFTRLANDLTWTVEDGPSDRISFPEEGPYDRRLGYTEIPRVTASLDTAGYALTQQARFSDDLERTVGWGAYPVYDAKVSAGLTVVDRRGRKIVEERFPGEAYTQFDSIPYLLWRTLLFIESREFLSEEPRRNPAVEWDRFVRSVGELGMKMLGAEGNVAGGSTLATQIEKYRHSPGGITRDPSDKLRQMFTASLRAYSDGPNTLQGRRRIVRDYLNSVPLAAQVGHGEVVGTADGLWAWYGLRLDSVNLALNSGPMDEAGRREQGEVYRRVVSLLLAHRRPTYYLTRPSGRDDLADLTDSYLGLMVGARMIPRWLADEARRARERVQVLDRAPPRPALSFTARKAVNYVRTQLLTATKTPGLYDLDRMDLRAESTLDIAWHEAATDLLRSMQDPVFNAANGLTAGRLLDTGDPSKVLYAVTLMERVGDVNVIRVQTDNYDGPLSLGASSRLELGSTAKLRTLVTYLEIIDEFYNQYGELSADSLGALTVAPRDRLATWTVEALRARPGSTREQLLDAAMTRTYSASPGERFATGGGVQTFNNFDATFNGRILSVRESFRNSVNLPFVRMMRDIVSHEMAELGTAQVLDEEGGPGRQEYLERFADAEGSRFLRGFFTKYRDAEGPEVFDRLVNERRLGSRRMAWAYRTVAPDADVEVFSAFIRQKATGESFTDEGLVRLYEQSDPTQFSLADLGYLSRVHPLELWLANYLVKHPNATQQEILDASREVRIEVYDWLFRTGRRDAQNQRIRTMLEIEAFQGVLRRWRRLGYPFRNIVPSLGTSIGSSGDRPEALAELAGIIMSDGVRYPVQRVKSIDIGLGTPYETRFRPRERAPDRVLSVEVARTLRAAMEDVVANGTARRARGALAGPDGQPLTLGGKTGTGDNRFRITRPGGGSESRVVNRTATLVFFAGEQYFGVVVAYVPGQEAAAYRFTSALPSQTLAILGGRLERLDTVPPTPNPEGG